MRASAHTLVIQTAFLGDVVLTTPLLTALAVRHGPVDIVTTPTAALLIETHPAVRQTISYDKRGADRGWDGLRRLASNQRCLVDVQKEHIVVYDSDWGSYQKVLRFTLTDEKSRTFRVQRWCFKGSIDDWIAQRAMKATASWPSRMGPRLPILPNCGPPLSMCRQRPICSKGRALATRRR